MTDLERAFRDAATLPAPLDKTAEAWALWFDILRERMAAAHGLHPLRTEDLFEEAE